jgi:uncharacterized repeat protein (TIGR03843 family)
MTQESKHPLLVDREAIHEILLHGDIELVGQLVWGSNYTFLVEVSHHGEVLPGVYKPARGEQPLWDFPPGTLANREVAAYIAARGLGWDMVPPTVLRPDGLAGSGSLQLYIETDPERHYFSFTEEEKQRLRPVALLDIVINNADRKGGHVFLDSMDHVWLIDHGVCFHQKFKLRTVIWDFVDEPIPEALLDRLSEFRDRLHTTDELCGQLMDLISAQEMDAMTTRIDWLLESRHFPGPGDNRPYPWPLI